MCLAVPGSVGTVVKDGCQGEVVVSWCRRFHREAAGVVQAIAPSVETTSADFRVQYAGDLIVGKLALGCGSFRTSVAGAFRNT